MAVDPLCYLPLDQMPAYMAVVHMPSQVDRYVVQYTYRTPDESSSWVTKM